LAGFKPSSARRIVDDGVAEQAGGARAGPPRRCPALAALAADGAGAPLRAPAAPAARHGAALSRAGALVTAHAEPGCRPGFGGRECRFFCPLSWSRLDDAHGDSVTDSYAPIACT